MSDEDGPEQGEPLQITLMRQLVDMSAQRSEMSQQRTYMNMERTMSVWLRTALAAMLVGIVVDRFGLFMLELPTRSTSRADTWDVASLWVGAAIVALGVVMSVATGARFWFYVARFRHYHEIPDLHGPVLATLFSLLVALSGIVLLVLMILSPR